MSLLGQTNCVGLQTLCPKRPRGCTTKFSLLGGPAQLGSRRQFILSPPRLLNDWLLPVIAKVKAMTRNERRCRRPTPMRFKIGAMTVIVVVVSSLLLLLMQPCILLVNSEAIPHVNDNRRINRRSLQATATGLLGSVACTGCAEASCLAVGTIGDAHCAQCAKGQTWWPCDQGTFIWWTNVN